MKPHWVVRRKVLTFSKTVNSQMALRLSALCAGRLLPPRSFPVLIYVRGWVDPTVIVRLEGLGQLKNPVTSSGIEPETFRLIAYCLNKLRYRTAIENVHKWRTTQRRNTIDCLACKYRKVTMLFPLQWSVTETGSVWMCHLHTYDMHYNSCRFASENCIK
jgi:hypothetical protein